MYVENFDFAKLPLCFGAWINFLPKVAISSIQSLTQDKKISVINFLPMRAGGESFSWRNIPCIQ